MHERKGCVTVSIKKFGFDDFNEDIQRLKKNIPDALEEYLFEMALRLEAKAKEKTPTFKGKYPNGRTGGELKRNWFVSKITKDGDKLKITVFNPTPHAIHVEYGHRTRQGKGTAEGYKPKPNGKAFVEGKFMLEKSLKELKKEMPIHLQKVLKELID